MACQRLAQGGRFLSIPEGMTAFSRKAIMARGAVHAAACWIASAGTMVVMAAWIGADTNGIPAFDREGLVLANAWRSARLDDIFLHLTWIGSLKLLLPLVLAAGMGLWRSGFRDEAGFLVTALVGASALAQLAKHLALRPRPDLFVALTSVDSPLSLPSGHAVQVTAVGLASLFIAVRLAPSYWRCAVSLLVSIVALVGFSRLYLQVHYPSDILAGTLAAAFWVAGLRSFMFARRRHIA